MSVSRTLLSGRLNMFNAKLSLKRYRRGPRSQEVGEEGDYTQRCTVTTGMTLAMKMDSDESHFNECRCSEGQSHKQVSTDHSF